MTRHKKKKASCILGIEDSIENGNIYAKPGHIRISNRIKSEISDYHQVSGHEIELRHEIEQGGDGEGQGNLLCCIQSMRLQRVIHDCTATMHEKNPHVKILGENRNCIN